MDAEALRQIKRLTSDFGAYAGECLRIRTKGGETAPFIMNAAQRYVHKKLEEQRAARGWVRAMIFKGRQQGISTYVGARFYYRAATRRNVNVYILTHEQPATDALFAIVDRYQANNPLAPHVGAANAKELVFDKLESCYSVATAGQKAGGRSRTITLYHGSEVAFWANAADHFASSVQAVPLLPGTEIVLESTSAGPSGEWYERWQDAVAGRTEYTPIFVPWFLSDEYAIDPPEGFELSEDVPDGGVSEKEYQALYGLTLRQMAWRRWKIGELRSELKWSYEYPATPSEGFTSASSEAFIAAGPVLRARKRTTAGGGPLILGVDPAGMGKDRFAVAARRGMRVEWVKQRTKLDHREGALWVKTLIDEYSPARVYVDLGNMGAAIVSELMAYGPEYALHVRGVNFGSSSEHRCATPGVPGPYNRRAEMYDRFRDWLSDPAGADIPDDDALQADATAAKIKPRADCNFLLESKEEMRKRGVRSPDKSDAVVLTFASFEFIPEYAGKQAAMSQPTVEATQDRAVTQSMGLYGWMA